MNVMMVTMISTLILTIATKIGFIIQRVYFDIKGIALASLLTVVTCLVTLGYPIVSALVSIIMFLYLLCKIGEIELLPDAILAAIIGIGILSFIAVNNFEKFNVFY